jgi:hypothetical protein
MRAATAFLSLLQSAGGSSLWRADEVPADQFCGPALATGHAELDRELPGGGWPQGQLTELLTDDTGIGELSLLAPALAQLAHARRSTVWVLPSDGARGLEAQALPYAPALAAAGVDLARTIFVKPATPREGLWAIEQALRAQHLGAVLGWLPAGASPSGDFKALRRLHLLAQRHRTLTFVLRATQHAQSPSPAALRLQLAARPHDTRGDVAEAARPSAAGTGRALAASAALGQRRNRPRTGSRIERAARSKDGAARRAVIAGDTGSLRLARVADREHLPLVPIGLVPVDHAATVVGVDLHIDGPADRTAIRNARRLEAAEDGVELLLADAKAEVIDRKRLGRSDEVERQPLVDVDR